MQERLTHELAGAVSALAGAGGVLVVVEALHMCMVARGVEKHASRCGLQLCNRQLGHCRGHRRVCHEGACQNMVHLMCNGWGSVRDTYG